MFKKFSHEVVAIIDKETGTKRRDDSSFFFTSSMYEKKDVDPNEYNVGSLLAMELKDAAEKKFLSKIKNETISAFNKAVCNGDLEEIKKILKDDIGEDKNQSLFLKSDLHSAVPIAVTNIFTGKDTKKHKEVFEWLLKNGAHKDKELVLNDERGGLDNHGSVQQIIEKYLDNTNDPEKALDLVSEVVDVLANSIIVEVDKLPKTSDDSKLRGLFCSKPW